MKKFYKNHWPLFLIGAFIIYFLVLVYIVLNVELSTLQAILLSAGGPSLIMLTIGDPYVFSAGWKTLFKPIIELYNRITKRGMCRINNVYFYPGTVFNEFTISDAKTIVVAMFEIYDRQHPILHSKLFSIPVVYTDFPGTSNEKVYTVNLNELSKQSLRDIFQALCGYNEIHRVKEIRAFQYQGL